jgi:5-methylcytosine-specific restriction endonuclease McrA
MRKCIDCDIEKEITEFHKIENWRRHRCKKCHNLRFQPATGKENTGRYKKGHRPDNGFLKGHKPHNYIDGKGDLRALEVRKNYKSTKAKKCRLKVLERDGYKCKKCLAYNKKLHIHHIIPLRIDSSKAYDLDNLITLCPKCHAEEERNITVV